MAIGRPVLDIRESKIETYLNCLRDGLTERQAARATGICYLTWLRLARRDPKFGEKRTREIERNRRERRRTVEARERLARQSPRKSASDWVLGR